MFSTNARENTKLIDNAFIAGVTQENIQKYILNQDSPILIPEFLVTFLNTEDELSSAVLDVKYLFRYL